jgi:small subunit ribosomal protein S17
MAKKKDDVTDENQEGAAEEEQAGADAQPDGVDAEAADAAVEAAQEADEPVETLVPAAEADASESAPEEPAAEEPAAEDAATEPEPEGDAVADAPAAEAAEDEAEPAEEAAPAASEDTVAEAPVAEPKRKKKRLPRALRPPRSKPKRPQGGGRKPIVRLEKPEHLRGRRQERQGVLVSDAMDKTIVVKVDVIKAHPRYRKVVRRSVKFHAHDERNEAKAGDVVRIVETRPLSATKRWRLVEIVEAAK